MSALRRIDDFVLDNVFQPAVNKTGIDPAAAARSLFVGDAIFTSCRTMAEYVAGSLTASDAVMAAVVIAAVLPLAWMQQDAPSSGLAPASRNHGLVLRVLGWPIVLSNFIHEVVKGFDLAGLFDTAAISAFLFALHLGACRMPPPKSAVERTGGFARAGAR